ncbi:MAG: ferredoxin [Chloroflexi bacterium]|nr:ferredoxin [Chloroflexota bacterium]
MSAGDGATAGLRAIVDRAECFGFGYCAEALPAVFHLDAEGKSVATDVEVDRALLLRAADDCPRAAISLLPTAGRMPDAPSGEPTA